MQLGKERLSVPELSLQLIEAFAKTFIYRHDCYPIQLANGAYITLKEPLTLDLVVAHLRGEMTLGAYALDSESIAHWICFDADTDEKWQDFKELSLSLQAQNISHYLELSRRGGHLWLFTSPLPGKVIRQFGTQLLAQNDISIYDDKGKMRIELYPKQDELRIGTGSLVRLPFGIHRKTGKRYPFITPTGKPLAPTIREQIALLTNPALVQKAFIDQILAQVPEAPTPPPVPSKKIFAKVSRPTGETLSERIKNAISVFDFVSRYVELDQLGKGYCPFHDDQEKSFSVHQERNFWHCYAGCEGQTVIDFWMRWRETHGQEGSFKATVKDLAQMLFG
jgi:hypothetical protein